MNDIYICDSYYHLLVTLVKNIKLDKKNDLLISSEGYNNYLLRDIELLNRLRDSHLFKNIYFFDYSKLQIECMSGNKIISFMKNYKLYKTLRNEYTFNFKKYNNIYIYLDTGLLGRILNYKKIKYHLIEDGLDCYKSNYYLSNSSKAREKIKRTIKKIMYGYSGFASSKNILSIEVNSLKGLKINKLKCIEIPRKKLFSNLTLEEKEKVYSIFMDNIRLLELNNYSMIMTQPLFQDGLISSEKEQIRIYKTIKQEYLSNEKVIIKVHPRDTVNYKDEFKDCIILYKKFPIELLSFDTNCRFNKVISIASTATDFIENSNEKIKLGWKWLDEIKK